MSDLTTNIRERGKKGVQFLAIRCYIDEGEEEELKIREFVGIPPAVRWWDGQQIERGPFFYLFVPKEEKRDHVVLIRATSRKRERNAHCIFLYSIQTDTQPERLYTQTTRGPIMHSSSTQLTGWLNLNDDYRSPTLSKGQTTISFLYYTTRSSFLISKTVISVRKNFYVLPKEELYKLVIRRGWREHSNIEIAISVS